MRMGSWSVEAAVQRFTDEVKRLYGDELLSVVLYGSTASGEHIPGRSNINVVVLLKEVTPAQLKKSARHLRGWRRRGGVTPLFLDPAYVRSSTDAFPIEFLDMQERSRVIYGQDFLRDLQISRTHLRFQCEQELKAKLLRLRQLFLEAGQSPRTLRALIADSVGSFLILLKTVLRLRGIEPPHAPEAILARLGELGLPIEALADAVKLKREGSKPGREATEALFERYIAEIQAAVDVVDRMTAS